MAAVTDELNNSEEFKHAWQPLLGRFQAPGRVNLIGEHTDYNDGFVLPAAIQLQTRVGVAAVLSREIWAQSNAFPGVTRFSLDDPNPQPAKEWSDYIRGVALEIEQAGLRLTGARLVIESDIPPGAGLSSSAALEVAAALALLANSNLHLEPIQVAQLCHRAENNFVGTRSGIMDQFASCCGRRGHALLLDCRSLEKRYVPMPGSVAMMVCNTMVRHQLAAGEYNARRQQCEQAVAILSRFISGIHALRDVSATQLASFSSELDPVLHRRCRHVISENQRVLTGAEALTNCDVARFGQLMVESHESLRLDYEVSCLELDIMCELALQMTGVYGARMIGGGFGGCVLALVEQSAVAVFREQIAQQYQRRTGIVCESYECFAADAAGPIEG